MICAQVASVECLNAHWFASLTEAKRIVETRREVVLAGLSERTHPTNGEISPESWYKKRVQSDKKLLTTRGLVTRLCTKAPDLAQTVPSEK